MDRDHIINEVDVMNLREELRSSQHFLVDSELERANNKGFNYATENLKATIVDGKFDRFCNNLKCAAEVNLAFGFILENIEEGGFRVFSAHENNTLLGRSNSMCTKNDSAKPKNNRYTTDVIELHSKERNENKLEVLQT